jgi:hypothetical protein
MEQQEIYVRLLKVGISETDAKVIADCAATKSSASWVNTDPISRESIKALLDMNNEHKFGLSFSIKEVPNRGKYIWEVKALQPNKK